jgi:hypothetical protein
MLKLIQILLLFILLGTMWCRCTTLNSHPFWGEIFFQVSDKMSHESFAGVIDPLVCVLQHGAENLDRQGS